MSSTRTGREAGRTASLSLGQDPGDVPFSVHSCSADHESSHNIDGILLSEKNTKQIRKTESE